MSKNTYPDNDIRNTQAALDKLGATIHVAPPAVQQAYIDLVATFTRYKDANTDDLK
jgi:hypothetical protein